jgi:hypothetical protein
VAGVLLLLNWAGLVLLWDLVVGQLLALRQALLALDGPEVWFPHVWPIWVEGTLLFPTIAGLIQLFRPKQPGQPAPAQAPAQLARPAHPTQQRLKRGKRQATLPSPAVRPDPPHDSPSQRSS